MRALPGEVIEKEWVGEQYHLLRLLWRRGSRPCPGLHSFCCLFGVAGAIVELMSCKADPSLRNPKSLWHLALHPTFYFTSLTSTPPQFLPLPIAQNAHWQYLCSHDESIGFYSFYCCDPLFQVIFVIFLLRTLKTLKFHPNHSSLRVFFTQIILSHLRSQVHRTYVYVSTFFPLLFSQKGEDLS